MCLACCAPAAAVIKVELPVARMYETAEVVLVATIERVNADTRVLEARVAETLKGRAMGRRLRNVLATAVEANGDKRPDIFLLAEGGPALLVNRGFEAFFLLVGSGTALTEPGPPGRAPGLDRPAALAAADVDGDGLEDLLVLTRDGRVWTAANAEARRPR